jgi:nitrate reductase NapE component
VISHAGLTTQICSADVVVVEVLISVVLAGGFCGGCGFLISWMIVMKILA